MTSAQYSIHMTHVVYHVRESHDTCSVSCESYDTCSVSYMYMIHAVYHVRESHDTCVYHVSHMIHAVYHTCT